MHSFDWRVIVKVLYGQAWVWRRSRNRLHTKQKYNTICNGQHYRHTNTNNI